MGEEEPTFHMDAFMQHRMHILGRLHNCYVCGLPINLLFPSYIPLSSIFLQHMPCGKLYSLNDLEHACTSSLYSLSASSEILLRFIATIVIALAIRLK